MPNKRQKRRRSREPAKENAGAPLTRELDDLEAERISISQTLEASQQTNLRTQRLIEEIMARSDYSIETARQSARLIVLSRETVQRHSEAEMRQSRVEQSLASLSIA